MLSWFVFWSGSDQNSYTTYKVWHRQKEECETQSVLSVGQKGDMWLLDTVYITLCHHHIFMALLHYKEEPFWYLWKNLNMIQQSWCKKAVLRFPVIFCAKPWGSLCFWIASHSYVFVLVLQNRSQKQSRLLLAVQQLNDNTEMAKNPEEQKTAHPKMRTRMRPALQKWHKAVFSMQIPVFHCSSKPHIFFSQISS